MRIKVKQVAITGWWTTGRIGEVFEVKQVKGDYTEEHVKYPETAYKVRNNDAPAWILARDCEVVDEESKEAVNHPSHYNYGDIEVIDFIDQVTDSYEGKAAYLAGNVIKYVSRAPHKNGAEDVEKAIWYAKRLADVMETKGDE